MLKTKLKQLLLILLFFVFLPVRSQQPPMKEWRSTSLTVFGGKSILLLDSQDLITNYINFNQPDFNSLAFKKKEPKSPFNLKELTNLVERYCVYEKRFVSLGMIPPKIKIAIKEKSK